MAPEKTLEDAAQQLQRVLQTNDQEAIKTHAAALQALAFADLAYRAKQLLVFLGYDAGGTLDLYAVKIADAITQRGE